MQTFPLAVVLVMDNERTKCFCQLLDTKIIIAIVAIIAIICCHFISTAHVNIHDLRI